MCLIPLLACSTDLFPVPFFVAAYGGPLNRGDVVYLRSHDSSLPYIAVVERCEGPQLLCRWLYRYADLPSELRSGIEVGEFGEVYLSTHKDENTRDTVLGLCHVVAAVDQHSLAHNAYLCRYTFDIKKGELVPLRKAEWNVRESAAFGGVDGSASSSTVKRAVVSAHVGTQVNTHISIHVTAHVTNRWPLAVALTSVPFGIRNVVAVQ